MTATSEIKVRLDAGLKKQFEQACRDGGTTMTAEVNRLILALVECGGASAGQRPGDQAKANPAEGGGQDCAVVETAVGEQVLAALGQVAQRIEQLVAAHPQFWFEKWYAGRAIQTRDFLEKLSAAQGAHQKAVNDGQSAVRAHIEEFARLALHREPRFYRSYKIWTAFAAGALALLLTIALLPGESGLARFTAIKMVGGKSPLHAAEIIAGGDAFHGNLIHETAAFMAVEPFASQYGACAERAKHAHKDQSCTLKFPPIVEDR
jgi:hypothetical protein